MRGPLIVLTSVLLMLDTASSEEALLIAPRQQASPERREDALADVLQDLGENEAREVERYQGLQRIAHRLDRTGGELVDHLDASKFQDWRMRRGALRAIHALGINSPRISSAMAWSATRDPDASVREEAVDMIRARGDRRASDLLARHLIGAFDTQGTVIQQDVHDHAVHALRTLGDRRTAEALLTYVFAEIRAGVAENMGMTTQHIRSVVPTQGAGAIGLDLPIEQPNISVMQFQGTVVVPALEALRALTGQNLGENREEWQRWIRTHPPSDWR